MTNNLARLKTCDYAKKLQMICPSVFMLSAKGNPAFVEDRCPQQKNSYVFFFALLILKCYNNNNINGELQSKNRFI